MILKVNKVRVCRKGFGRSCLLFRKEKENVNRRFGYFVVVFEVLIKFLK